MITHQVDTFRAFKENLNVAKDLLRLCQAQTSVEHEFRKVKEFLLQVKHTLPFLPEPDDLVSPPEKILDDISHKIEPEIKRCSSEMSRLCPKVVLVFAVSSLNEFLFSRLKVFKKRGLYRSHEVAPFDSVFSMSEDFIREALGTSSSLFHDLGEIFATTRSIMYSRASGTDRTCMTRNQNKFSSAGCRNGVTVSEVIRYIEKMEQFAQIVNEAYFRI